MEINISMTWSNNLLPLLAVYADGTPQGVKEAFAELRRMASAADRAVILNAELTALNAARWPHETTLTRDDRASHLETIWSALAGYREDCIPEGTPEHDEEWSDICTAMAWITEDLETAEKGEG